MLNCIVHSYLRAVVDNVIDIMTSSVPLINKQRIVNGPGFLQHYCCIKNVRIGLYPDLVDELGTSLHCTLHYS